MGSLVAALANLGTSVTGFLTDVLELRFSSPASLAANSSVWHSLLYAFLEGAAQSLGIARDDIDGCLYPYGPHGQAPSIVLYDSIPGGAGNVAG